MPKKAPRKRKKAPPVPAPAVMPPPPPPRDRVPWRTIIAAVVVVQVSGLAIFFFIELKKVLFHIVLAMFLAIVLNPPIARLQRWRLSRGAAIAAVTGGLALASLGISALVAAPLATQAARFAVEAPTYLEQAKTGKGPIARAARKLHLEGQLARAAPNLSKTLSNLSNQVLTLGRRIASAAFATTIVLILTLFMLVEGPKVVSTFMAGVPPPYIDAVQRIGRTVSRVVSGYTTGVLFMALLNGLVAGLALLVTGTPFVIPLAVWAGVVDVLPIVGGLFAVIPAGLFAFLHSVPAGIIVVAAILVYQQIKNHLLYPVIVGRAVQLSSLLVLIAVLVGAELGHVAGAVLAIPFAGTVNAIVAELIRWRRERRLAAAEAAA